MKKFPFIAGFVICVVMAASAFSLLAPEKIEASSHREAPYMTTVPKVDITDFYMFQSYDDANQGTNDRTTLIMNFHPLQDAFGGPNYFFPDENALYQINIDNNGNGLPNVIFRIQFNFKNNNFRKLTVNTNDDGGDTQTEIPLIALPTIENEADPQLNVIESYTLTIIKNGAAQQAININNSTNNSNFAGTTTFVKPLDNIGNVTIPDYDSYVNEHIYDFTAFGQQGRVFVGQRNDPFIVNLGEIFDGLTINTNDLDAIAVKNVTSFCIEVPTAFLALNDDPVTNNVFGGWATTLQRGQVQVFTTVGQGNLQNNGLPKGGTVFKQVSRLGMPLVNEAVIGVSVKDRFNNSIPAFDAQFAGFVTDSTLAVVMNLVNLNGVIDVAPTNERGDLVQIFAQGVDFTGLGLGSNVNNIFGPGVAEYQRLDVSIAPTDLLAQNAIGLAGGDDAGFPNGRRPIDDTVDIALKVVAGLLANALTGGAIVGDADAGAATDGVGEVAAENIASEGLIEDFPFLGTPISGRN